MSTENINLDQAIEEISSLANKDQCDVEVLTSESKNFTASHQKKKLDKFDVSTSRSLGVRVIKDGREGCAYTENLSADSIKQTYKEAISNAAILEKNYEPELMSPQPVKELEGTFSSSLENVSVDDKLKLSHDLEAFALDLDAQVTAAPYNAYSDFTNFTKIFNSKGVDSEFKQNGCYAYLYLLAKSKNNENDTAMSSEVASSRSFDKLDVGELAKLAVESTVSKLGGVIPESKNYAVVFNNHAMNSVIEMISNYFSAKSVEEKTSPLTNKLGETIFSKNISIADDPFLTKAFGCRPFDSEGTPSQKTTLVDKGTLKTLLTNSVFAKKLNLGNTGNASRSPSSELDISPSNLIIEPGSKSPQDLLNSYPEVVLIDQIKGRAGFNGISGDFSMESSGYIYKNGKLDRAIKNFVVSGNIMDMLLNVEAVGNDPKIEFSTVVSPSILIPSLTIAGQ